MDTTNLDIEQCPFKDKAQIFETTINPFKKDSDVSVPYNLWLQYFSKFKWLSYKYNILNCWICQEAFIKFPKDVECNEWTFPSELSYKEINKNNLILILKLHNFSDNHIRASVLLNKFSEYDVDSCASNSSYIKKSVQSASPTTYNFVSLTLKNNELDQNSENMELLRNFNMRHFENLNNQANFPKTVIDLVNENMLDYLEPLQPLYPCYSSNGNLNSINFNPWVRYLTRYHWLYLKDNNPGCKYCEQAFKLSLQMSYTKWTSPNMLSESISQDRPNRTLLQHDRSKNHKIAEDVLIEHNIITPSVISKPKIEELKNDHTVGNTIEIDESQQQSECPPEFTVERWDRFTKNYPWLYFHHQLFHCTYCERAFERHRNRMTQTSWTSSQFDYTRIKDMCKARHYFYDHQRSNNHRIAKNVLQMEGIVSTKTSIVDDDDYLEKLSNLDDDPKIFDNCTDFVRTLSPCEESQDKILNEKQWQQLCGKYPWLVGAMGKSYGCSICQQGRKMNPLTVNISQWTQGSIQFTKTKYIQLRKSLWCHSITRNHINSAAALQQSITSTVNGDHSKLEAISIVHHNCVD